MLYKNTFKKIKRSLGRYLSLMLIVMVGVGFYAGIQVSVPDIRSTAQDYYQANSLYDFKVYSSMGLTEEDVEALQAIDGIQSLQASQQIDVLVEGEVIRFHQMDDDVNQPTLVEGRLPQTSSEVLGDMQTYQLGETITVSDDSFAIDEFIVVGLIDSSLYITDDYGMTILGTGKVSSFVMAMPEAFSVDVFTVLYGQLSDTIVAYTDEYQTKLDEVITSVERIQEDREAARLAMIVDEAKQEIAENEALLIQEEADGKVQLEEARLTLVTQQQALDQAATSLEANQITWQTQKQTALTTFTESKNTLDSNREQLVKALTAQGIDEQQLPELIETLKVQEQALEALLAQTSTEDSNYPTLQAQLETLKTQSQGLQTIQTNLETIDSNLKTLKTQSREFEKTIETTEASLQEGETQLKSHQLQLAAGWETWRENENEFTTKIAEAWAEIDQAKADVDQLKPPTWTIQTRTAIKGYTELDGSIDVVETVAQVFPLFFILIVMLMSSNSMSRMIAEERMEQGTLASLGYSNRQITSGYLFYALSATILGVVIGFFIGCLVIPPLIYMNFAYRLPTLNYQFDLTLLMICLVVGILLLSGVTLWTCRRELRQAPAILMRPLPPKQGQRILVERIPWLWKALSFNWKITLRNIFRYKKRGLMTIVGVAGCTALLLVGFGLRDSMQGIASKQYGDLLTYDVMVTLDDEVKSISSELAESLTQLGIDQEVLIKQNNLEINAHDLQDDVYVVVPESVEGFNRYYHLQDKETAIPLNLEDGAVLTQKVAQQLGVTVGESVTLRDGDGYTHTVTITAIAENYLGNYLYMSPEQYRQDFATTLTYNTLVSEQADTTNEAASTALMEVDHVIHVQFSDEVRAEVMETNASLDGIVILIVVIASLLALVVLYNLTSINISEREREIATLKVLGFQDQEANHFIYREALVLSLLSILIGLGLGNLLHGFVVSIIEGPGIVFFRTILLWSYLYAAALTLIFTWIMQQITGRVVQKIDMIQALKSVE